MNLNKKLPPLKGRESDRGTTLVGCLLAAHFVPTTRGSLSDRMRS